jgi:hypothetical protein
MRPQKKLTNERASEYEISVAFPFSADTISKPSKNEPINGHAKIPALQLTHCACICIRFNSDTFSTERSPNYLQLFYILTRLIHTIPLSNR